MFEIVTIGAAFSIGERRAYPISLPCELTDSQQLNGQDVILDGRRCTVTGTELFMHAPPWRVGEAASITVRWHDGAVRGEGREGHYPGWVAFDTPLTRCGWCQEDHRGGCLRPGCVYPTWQTVVEPTGPDATVADRVRELRRQRLAVKATLTVPSSAADWRERWKWG